MRFTVAVILSSVVTFSSAAFAQQARWESVPEAIGVKMSAEAPRLAERKSAAPVVTLADAETAAAGELDALYSWNEQGRRPMKNGFTRSIGGAITVDLASMAASANGSRIGSVESTSRGSVIWSGSVKVAGAYRLRLHLTDVALPADTLFWTYGVGEKPIAFGMELVDDRGELYAPSVAGDTAYLEIEVPGVAALSRASFKISDVLEIVPVTREAAAALKLQPNDEPACLIDATCVTAGDFALINEYRAAVAQLQFVKDGSGRVCTGGLLNDLDSSTRIPYFLTANHCFSSQASATSLEAFWDYKSASCGGNFPDFSTLQRSNGAQLLATNASTDFSFVRLNSIPSNRTFLGWNANATAVNSGTVLYRVSHPYPDQFAQPAVQAFSATKANLTTSTCDGIGRPNYIYSDRFVGGVYGGSSGSPVVLQDLAVVGQLFGQCGAEPSSGCVDSNSIVDGAFSKTFSSISSFLQSGGSGGTGPCVANSTTACMLGNRFRVSVRYRGAFDNAPANQNALVKSVTGFANPSFETGFFYFNDPNNIEMLIKILDQGNVDSQGRRTIAVLFGSATPLRVELTITDTTTGVTKNYLSEFSKMSGATDFTAFLK